MPTDINKDMVSSTMLPIGSPEDQMDSRKQNKQSQQSGSSNTSNNTDQKLRHQKAASLIHDWLNDTSDYDEQTYPKIQAGLKMRCREG